VASCAQTLATSGKVSVTAESVCALCAAAAKHPDPEVRNSDYLAEEFVSEAFWASYRGDPDRARHNLIGSDGHRDGMMGEFTRIVHLRVP